ncbi:Rossmann-like and DUF2520 domain-containing protein [Rufibacter roseus]|uniref:Rossmann-like and DUF2520 domain-containing protein n=1 Tax=Rufibacter roseus TaxID=1567108 RepID=A0ABW2DIC1_9BACT|nr:Rossmann-like and DUF2520 domain-containing protein [Rufibacter roseus]
MENEVTVGIVGAGNVACHLVRGLQKAGVKIALVYSRTIANAQKLAACSANTIATGSLDFTAAPPADVYLMAVPDQVLPQLAEQAIFPTQSIVAHTSGTQPLEVLSLPRAGGSFGVFYPLQTFSKEKEVDWQKVPLCLEASSPEAEQKLWFLAQKLSQQVVAMPGEKRRQLHLAAVFACNFTNHLLGVAQEVLKAADLPLNLLEPLVQETVSKAFEHPPFAVQTGPAQRGDVSTIQAHLQLLNALPQYQDLYQTLTDSIQTTAGLDPFSGE